jgi:hypothetical protein
MIPSVIAVVAASLCVPADTDAAEFQRTGRWPAAHVEAAVRRFFAPDTPAKDLAGLAESDSVRPYLYLTARRAAKVNVGAEDALLRALAEAIRERLGGGVFAKRIDLLMEAGIVAASKPLDPDAAKRRPPPKVGRHTDPELAREAFRQMQELVTDLGSHPIIEKYSAQIEKRWKRKWPTYLTQEVERCNSFHFKTGDEYYRMNGSDWGLDAPPSRPATSCSSGTRRRRCTSTASPTCSGTGWTCGRVRPHSGMT